MTEDPELQRRWGRLWQELPELKRHAGRAFPTDQRLEPVLDPKLPDRGYYVDPLSGEVWQLSADGAVRYLHPFGSTAELYRDGELLDSRDLGAGDAPRHP